MNASAIVCCAKYVGDIAVAQTLSDYESEIEKLERDLTEKYKAIKGFVCQLFSVIHSDGTRLAAKNFAMQQSMKARLSELNEQAQLIMQLESRLNVLHGREANELGGKPPITIDRVMAEAMERSGFCMLLISNTRCSQKQSQPTE